MPKKYGPANVLLTNGCRFGGISCVAVYLATRSQCIMLLTGLRKPILHLLLSFKENRNTVLLAHNIVLDGKVFLKQNYSGILVFIASDGRAQQES